MRAHSSDSTAPSSAMVSVGTTSCWAVAHSKGGSASFGSALRDAAEARADGLDRGAQPEGDGGHQPPAR